MWISFLPSFLPSLLSVYRPHMTHWEGWEMYFRTLKNPNALAVLPTRFVPPTQPDESTPSDILAVVEIGREEEDHDNEDQDTVDSTPTISTRRLLVGG